MSAKGLCLLACLGLLPLALSARVVWNVEVAEQVTLEGRSLPLYRVGTHREFGFKLYVGAFYLVATNLTAQQLIDYEGPIVFRTHYTFGIPHKLLLDGTRRHFRKALGAEVSNWQKELDVFIPGYIRGFEPGDLVELRWRKATGIEMWFSGKHTATVPGLAFKKMLFGTWFHPETTAKDFIAEVLRTQVP